MVTVDGSAIKKWMRRYRGFIWAWVCLIAFGGAVGIVAAIAMAPIKEEARQGDLDAQVEMCMRNIESRRYRKAATWCLLAAEQGHPGAQYELGSMYAYGKGVARDSGEGFRLIKLAAEAHDWDAQVHLSSLYRRGIGVDVDVVSAYMWEDIAAYNPRSKRTSVLVEMTAEQRETALRASLEWRKDNPAYLASDEPEVSEKSEP